MEKIRVKDRIMFEWFKKTGESNPRTKLDNIAQAIGYTYIGAFAAAKGGGVAEKQSNAEAPQDTAASVDPETLVEPELRDAFREQMNGIRSETS
jgi:hypothetical protein